MNDEFFNETLNDLLQPARPEMIQKQIGNKTVEMVYRTKNEERALKARQRAGEKLPGRAVWKNGRRVRKIENLTNRDYIILILLSKTRYASTTQLATLHRVKPNTVSKRMQLLENINLVKGFTMVEGGKKIWGLTGKGLNLLHNNNLIPENEGQKGYKPTEKMGHYLAITQAYIMFMYGKAAKGFAPVSINNILSERYIERAFRAFNCQKELIYTNTRRRAQDAFNMAERTGEFSNIQRTPQVWVPLNNERGTWHLPDFAISLEEKRNSLKPVSWAVEVELSTKNAKELENIMLAYKNSKQYAGVFYVIQEDTVGRNVYKAAKKVGLNNVRFIRLLDKDFKRYTGLKCWDL